MRVSRCCGMQRAEVGTPQKHDDFANLLMLIILGNREAASSYESGCRVAQIDR